MTAPSARQRRLAYLAWTAVCLIWGTTYLGIRVSLESVPPLLMGGIRWVTAGSLLTIYLLGRGVELPRRQQWAGIAMLGFLLLFIGNGGVVVAEQWLPSGLAAVIVAACPFWMSAIEACLPDGERLRAGVVTGLVVGFSGILVLLWPELLAGGSRRFVAGVVSLQIASIGWAFGSSYSRRHARKENVLPTTAFQMLAGGLMMALVGTVRGEWTHLFFTTRTLIAMAYLSTAGAIGGFVAYTYALRYLPVSFVSLYAYINPIIAVGLGIVLLREPFDARMTVAAALVFAGVAAVQWGSRERQQALQNGRNAAGRRIA